MRLHEGKQDCQLSFIDSSSLWLNCCIDKNEKNTDKAKDIKWFLRLCWKAFSKDVHGSSPVLRTWWCHSQNLLCNIQLGFLVVLLSESLQLQLCCTESSNLVYRCVWKTVSLKHLLPRGWIYNPFPWTKWCDSHYILQLSLSAILVNVLPAGETGLIIT